MEAIVAVYTDWGIGAKGTQPVTLRADRVHFRQLTENACVIVGRKTIADFPGGKPLPHRVNLILTGTDKAIPGGVAVHSPEEAAAYAQAYDRVMVIGGASVYGQMLPLCSRVYVTKIGSCPQSDVFFPNLDESPLWVCVEESPVAYENGIPYRFCVYTRKECCPGTSLSFHCEGQA